MATLGLRDHRHSGSSRRAWLLAIAAAALLPACATLTPPHAEGARVLTGRLSVRVDGDAARALSAAFELSGDADNGALVLTSPLGSTLAQARWTPGQGALLETPGQSTRYPDLDTLAQQALGERVPLAALFDWLRARPWPGAGSQPLAGEPGFTQLGWRVLLARYAEGWVEARRDAAPAVTVRARLDQAAAAAQ